MKHLMIFFIFCASLFAQSNINEDTIHFVGQASVFTVGSELVTNGTFTGNASGWTVGGWSYSSNAILEDNAGSDSDLTQNITGLTDGRVYRIQFEVTVYTDGNVTAVFDGVELGDKGSTGVFTGYAAAVGTDADIDIRADATFTGTIDNVSVVAWVGDLDAGGGCTIDTFTGTLSDYMSATGGVLYNESGVPITDDGGDIQFEMSSGATMPLIGTLVKVDFSQALGSGVDDGTFEVIRVNGWLFTIDTAFTAGDNAFIAGVWIGGAYPDIATAINDSTLSQDPDSIYRKRYICVNVDREVDAVTDFVGEISETALREDDGSRKIIGFYDSITVANLGAGGGTYGYRVVSDMDYGQTYYAGARKAFNQDENFSVINPNGKWIEWNAKGNSIHILEMNSSGFEMRNIKIHNTAIGGTNALLFVDDASIFNLSFVNCWFATADLLHVQNGKFINHSMFSDCYFNNSIVLNTHSGIQHVAFTNCISNGTDRNIAADGTTFRMWYNCLFYKGSMGIRLNNGGIIFNCVFVDQTTTGIKWDSSTGQGFVINSIFSPASASDQAFLLNKGSFGALSFNNIFYSVSANSGAGAVLTNPITHAQISPNPALPKGTIEKDPLFVNPADGDFRLHSSSPAINGGMRSLFGGYSTIGANQPYSSPNAGYRSRYNFKGHNYSD